MDKDGDKADGGKLWKKTDYIPRRFDELPSEPEWTPVADVIRTQRENAAKQEREQVKIVPPSDSESDSDPQVPSPLPTREILGSSSKPVKKQEKEQHHKKGRSLQENSNKKSSREAATTNNKDDSDIDEISRSMTDWALKTDYEIKRKKHPNTHEHPPRSQSLYHPREYVGGGRNQRDYEPSRNFSHERDTGYWEKRKEEYYPEHQTREYYEEEDGDHFYERGERDYHDQEERDYHHSREKLDYYHDREQYYHHPHPERDMDSSHSYHYQAKGESHQGLTSADYQDREADRHRRRFEGEEGGRYSPHPHHDSHRRDQHYHPDDYSHIQHESRNTKHSDEHYTEHHDKYYREQGNEHFREHGGEYYREHEDQKYRSRNQQHPRNEYDNERSRRRAEREEVSYRSNRRDDDVLF